MSDNETESRVGFANRMADTSWCQARCSQAKAVSLLQNVPNSERQLNVLYG